MLTQVPQNVTLFRNRATADIISYDKVIRVGLNLTGVLTRNNLDTETDMHTGSTSSKDEGRDQDNAPEAKECQRWPANYKKLGNKLVSLANKACNSCSLGYEFEPHVGCKEYLKIKS